MVFQKKQNQVELTPAQAAEVDETRKGVENKKASDVVRAKQMGNADRPINSGPVEVRADAGDVQGAERAQVIREATDAVARIENKPERRVSQTEASMGQSGNLVPEASMSPLKPEKRGAIASFFETIADALYSAGGAVAETVEFVWRGVVGALIGAGLVALVPVFQGLGAAAIIPFIIANPVAWFVIAGAAAFSLWQAYAN